MKRVPLTRLLPLTMALSLIYVTACASPVTPTPTISPTPTPTATPTTPSITMIYPVNGGTIKAGNVTVMVSVNNFSIVTKLGQPGVPGEGHIHYFLDVEAPTTPGQPAVTAAGTYIATTNTSNLWPNISAGPHIFSAELVNNDHTPLVPPVVARAEVLAVETTTPIPTPTSVTVTLTAQSDTFDLKQITVPASAFVTILFKNQDIGETHNFSLYDSSSSITPLFRGGTVVGPNSTIYSFPAPSTPGTYYFKDDAHPASMSGNFFVE